MTEHTAEKDRAPHTHGGTDAPECTLYGARCRPDETRQQADEFAAMRSSYYVTPPAGGDSR